jgi:hypothetical protein
MSGGNVTALNQGTVSSDAYAMMALHSSVDVIQTYAVVVSVVIALIVLILTQRSAKKRETLNLISSIRNSTEYKASRIEYLALVNSTNNLVEFAKEENSESSQASIIEEMLNYYELISLGIRMGTLDEHFYKLWYRSSLVTDYRRLQPYIVELRRWTGVPTYFYQFERLATKWAANPKVKQEPTLLTRLTNILGL